MVPVACSGGPRGTVRTMKAAIATLLLLGAATHAAAGSADVARLRALASESGWVVAILDTGVHGAHPFLAGKVVSEACYSAHGDCPNGNDEQIGAGAGETCTYAPHTCRHGTHVAGIAAGRGDDFSGVARGAD